MNKHLKKIKQLVSSLDQTTTDFLQNIETTKHFKKVNYYFQKGLSIERVFKLKMELLESTISRMEKKLLQISSLKMI